MTTTQSPFTPGEALSSPSDLPCFRLADAGNIALYGNSVRDYDEGLGLLAIGNVFGEMVLYDLAELDCPALDDCLESILLPPCTEKTDIISLVCHLLWQTDHARLIAKLQWPVTLCIDPAFPSPWTGSWYLSDEQESILRERWGKSLVLNGLARHHDYLRNQFNIDFVELVPTLATRAAWNLEERHYYGVPKPLLCSDIIVFNILFTSGGLYFAWSNEEDLEIFEGQDRGDFTTLDIKTIEARCRPKILERVDRSGELYQFFENYLIYEMEQLGRNRWIEFRSRGGEIHESQFVFEPGSFNAFEF